MLPRFVPLHTPTMFKKGLHHPLERVPGLQGAYRSISAAHHHQHRNFQGQNRHRLPAKSGGQDQFKSVPECGNRC